MKNQTYRMSMLYDFYGDLLTDRQKEFYDLYYNEDFSLAEIAENYGISRQGVRDVIVRGEATLTEIEDKTHLIRRFHEMHRQIASIQVAADKLAELNRTQYQDRTIDQLVQEIKSLTEQLNKE